MSLRDDIVWLMDRAEDVPPRIHARGVWHDRQTGLGSRLGAPALNRAFEAMIEAPGTLTRSESAQVPCFHPFRQDGDLCPDCSVRDENGIPVAETSLVSARRVLYRWPLRATLARLRRVPVRPGRPPLDEALRALMRASGNLDAAAGALSGKYPVMGDPAVARGHLSYALTRARRLHSEHPPVDLRPRPVDDASEAQLNAEADPAAAQVT